MPNCFTLTRKTDLATGPVSLQKIDEELCKFFGDPVHPTQWYYCWYNIIGFSLAVGRSFDQQRKDTIEEINKSTTENDILYHTKMLAIINWLDDNFTTNAWYQVGK